MKAIVLAGGHATRLWPLTRDRAKPLLPLGGQPIMQYTTDALAEMEAVEEILISTNARFADDFKAFIAEQEYDNARVVVEDHRDEENKVGSLGAIIQLMDAEGVDDYLVVGGDNYPSFDLSAFAQSAQDMDAVMIACHEVDAINDAEAFGVVEVDAEQRITGFTEKPETPVSRLVSTAFYYFPASSLDLFTQYQEAHKDTDTDYLDEPGRLIEWGHTEVSMYAYPFDGAWHDIGTPENYLTALAAIGGGGTNNGEVSDSSLGENVWVLEGAIVESSDLDNCIVFPGANISGSRLDGCIVDEQAVVKDVELSGAVIGAFSRVQ